MRRGRALRQARRGCRGAYQEDEDGHHDDNDADTRTTRQKRPVDTHTDAELELALDAFRAPIARADFRSRGARERGFDRRTRRRRRNAREDGPKKKTSLKKPSSRRARAPRVRRRACARLSLDPASTVATAFREQTARIRFGSCRIVSGGDGDDGDAGDHLDHLDATQTGGWTSAADILAAAAAAGSDRSSDRTTLPVDQLTVESLRLEVPFKVEQLVTRDGARVDERRETCWMADEGVGGLAYSGKVMRPTPFTPSVDALRQLVERKTGQRFDCALLNLYPERSVACKYHKDPDLGRLWARDSVIVSLGETRRFAFRKESSGVREKRAPEHWFRVRGGDAVWMFGDCNDTWEHCVMPGESDVRGDANASDAPHLGGVQAVAGDGKARRRARTRRRRRGEKERVVRKNPREPPTRRRRFGFGARRARERRERAGNERRGRETIDAGVLFTTYET